ncbi:MAG: GNAT family N-acetyltransferase [Chloroflexota bacterium]|nr:GNAT family N-acetyltransferase [Chloroflexota bacterium]
MNAHIRTFTEHDYPASVAVVNAVFPEDQDTVEEWQHWDAHRDPKCNFRRWVAEVDGQVVAYGDYDQRSGMYHPRKFSVLVAVQPTYQGQGVGAALYNHILAELEPLEPLSLRAHVRADMTRSIRFLKDRGFREDMRFWESRLDVTAFDFSPYADAEERVRSHGIEIKTMAELVSDSQRDHKLFELDAALVQDVPHPEPHTPISYEFFNENLLQNPNLLPDGFFVALHNGRYVGMSNLWRSQASADLYTGLTGVCREYRRQGIALALKLRAITYAKARGTQIIKTSNESNNRPMLSINEQLGFVKQPIWISFLKVLREERE